MSQTFISRIPFCLALLFLSGNAYGYVGPSLGTGAIGVVIGIVSALGLAIIGVLWYPMKRLLKKSSDQNEEPERKPA